MESGEIKSRSPFSTETDTFYCMEALGSPWPAAVGFLGLPGSKMFGFFFGGGGSLVDRTTRNCIILKSWSGRPQVA